MEAVGSCRSGCGRQGPEDISIRSPDLPDAAGQAAGHFEKAGAAGWLGRPATLREPPARDRRNHPHAGLHWKGAGRRAPCDPGFGRRPCGQHARVPQGRISGKTSIATTAATAGFRGSSAGWAGAVRAPDLARRQGVLEGTASQHCRNGTILVAPPAGSVGIFRKMGRSRLARSCCGSGPRIRCRS